MEQHNTKMEHNDNSAVELLQRVDRKALEAFILAHISVDVIVDTFGSTETSDENGKIHTNDIADYTTLSSSSQLRIDTNIVGGIKESSNSSKNSSTVISRNSSNNNVNNPVEEEESAIPKVTDTLLILPDAPSSPHPQISSKPFKRRTPCICGDPVERWKNDAVRLRCKCLIHAQCLADHLQAELGSAFSKVSASGIRCPYFHTCKSYIGADDAAKFHNFLTTTGLQRQTEETGTTDSASAASAVTSGCDVSARFGTSEVSKLFQFSTAATFASSDLIYCPSCNVPFWVDEAFRSVSNSNRRVVCGNEKCALTFCWLCLVPWHRDLSCEEYKIITSANDQESQRFVVATSKPCPSCSTPLSHFHGHSCHHISPVGERGGGCPACHVHFCFACLSTAEENELIRGDRRACKCPQVTNIFFIMIIYLPSHNIFSPHDIFSR